MTTSWTHTGYAQRLHFGLDAMDKADAVVKEAGGRRVLLVTTKGRRQSEGGERLARTLGRMLVSVFDGVVSHVPTTAVQSAVGQALSDGVDAVVSFGGGSCADLGKAVCFFVEQQGGVPGASYADRPALAHVAIPTTYSGAELTPFFGMTDQGSHRKSGAGGPTIAPLAAVYDPIVTLDTPVRVSAETGMNALAHGVEAACSPSRSPEAEAVALACVRLVAAALPDVVDEPGDLGARTRMLEGSALGGRCLQNAGMGVEHGLAQLVGGRTGIAHGVANAILLSHAVRFNLEAVPEALWRVGDALGDAGRSGRGDRPASGAAGAPRVVVRGGRDHRRPRCGGAHELVESIDPWEPAASERGRRPRHPRGRLLRPPTAAP